MQSQVKGKSYQDRNKGEEYKKCTNHFHSQSSGKLGCCLCGKGEHVVTSDFQGRRVVESLHVKSLKFSIQKYKYTRNVLVCETRKNDEPNQTLSKE